MLFLIYHITFFNLPSLFKIKIFFLPIDSSADQSTNDSTRCGSKARSTVDPAGKWRLCFGSVIIGSSDTCGHTERSSRGADTVPLVTTQARRGSSWSGERKKQEENHTDTAETIDCVTAILSHHCHCLVKMISFLIYEKSTVILPFPAFSFCVFVTLSVALDTDIAIREPALIL